MRSCPCRTWSKEINAETTVGTWPSHMTAVGDVLFFVTGGWPAPPVLWKTDGSAAGTVRVADVAEVRHPIRFGDALVFGQREGLWTSDGTTAGTYVVAPIVMRQETAAGAPPITRFGDALFLIGCGPAQTCGLWRSDGTPDGTPFVTALEQGWPYGEEITTAGGMLFILYRQTLWTSDGTAGGTRRIVAAGTDGWYGNRQKSISRRGLSWRLSGSSMRPRASSVSAPRRPASPRRPKTTGAAPFRPATSKKAVPTSRVTWLMSANVNVSRPCGRTPIARSAGAGTTA